MTDVELAEEYYYKTYPVTLDIGEEERKKKVTDIFLAGLKADRPEWHKVADGDLPKESIPILILSSDNSIDECIYINGEGFKHPIFSNWYNPVAWIEKEKILPKKECE